MADCKVCGASVDEGKEYCDDCKPSEEGTKDEDTKEAPAEGGDATPEAPAEGGDAAEGEKKEDGE